MFSKVYTGGSNANTLDDFESGTELSLTARDRHNLNVNRNHNVQNTPTFIHTQTRSINNNSDMIHGQAQHAIATKLYLINRSGLVGHKHNFKCIQICRRRYCGCGCCPHPDWCKLHWKCFCCNCSVFCCLLGFLLFLLCTITLLVVIAYLGGYILVDIPKKPKCCSSSSSSASSSSSVSAQCSSFDWNAWDFVLNASVHSIGQNAFFDYYALLPSSSSELESETETQTENQNEYRNEFDAIVSAIAAADLTQLNCSEQFAFYINAYNIFAIKMVLAHTTHSGKLVDSITDISQYWNLRSVWNMDAGKIGGVAHTLDNIERDILRKHWGKQNPNIHSAIVCASNSCPNLKNSSYYGSSIDEQLHTQFVEYIQNTEKGMRVDDNGNGNGNGNENDAEGAADAESTLVLSMIFKWYASDFHPSVKKYIIKFMEDVNETVTKQIQSAKELEYFEYDWLLNKLPDE